MPGQGRCELLSPAARPTPGGPGGGLGDVAQLGERLPCKQQASGSIPLISTEPPGAAIAGEEDFLHGSMEISYGRSTVSAGYPSGGCRRAPPAVRGNRNGFTGCSVGVSAPGLGPGLSVRVVMISQWTQKQKSAAVAGSPSRCPNSTAMSQSGMATNRSASHAEASTIMTAGRLTPSTILRLGWTAREALRFGCGR
jgi:hypothetical protein